MSKYTTDPFENVGVLAAQSIGEKVTQLTLNSVDWNTNIIIMKNGELMTPLIGDWIDTCIETCDSSIIQHLDKQQLYIPLDDGCDWKALSCNEDGVMSWKRIEAITRHPVINEDGSNTILHVELGCAQSVSATKGRSFLKLVDGKIKPVNGCDLKVGDTLPVSRVLPNSGTTITHYDSCMNDVVWVPITSIQEVAPTHPWVYDITVEDNRTFTTSSGICMMDTFHSTGLSVGLVSSGVPRMNELLNTTCIKLEKCVVNTRMRNPTAKPLIYHWVQQNIIHYKLKDIVETFTFHNTTIDIIIDRRFLVKTKTTLTPIVSFLKQQVAIHDISYTITPLSIGCITVDIPSITLFIEFQRKWVELLDKTIHGIPNCMGLELDDDLRLYGIRLMDVIYFPELDMNRSTSNDVWEMYDLFGIEVTRQFLIDEIRVVIGTDIRECHINTIVDVMTFHGKPTAINRYGLRNMNVGFLSKATFEESVNTLLDSAFMNQTDDLTSTSSSIFTMRRPNTGTGLIELIQPPII